MTNEDLKLIIAVIAGLGGIYAFVTRPIRSDMAAMEARLKLEFKTDLASVEKELTAVEKRLNDRIDAWVIRR